MSWYTQHLSTTYFSSTYERAHLTISEIPAALAKALQMPKVSLAVLALPTSYVQHQVGTAGEKERGKNVCSSASSLHLSHNGVATVTK